MPPNVDIAEARVPRKKRLRTTALRLAFIGAIKSSYFSIIRLEVMKTSSSVVNFTNIFGAAVRPADPKSYKRQSIQAAFGASEFWDLWLMKLTPGVGKTSTRGERNEMKRRLIELQIFFSKEC